MRWWLACVVCVWGAGEAARAPCPAACACADAERERVYECRGYDVRGLPNDFARVFCNDGNFTCDQMSQIPLSQNGTLLSLTSQGCPASQTRCTLQRLVAADVQKLILESPVGELTADQVQGLSLTMLALFEAADQTQIPYDAISSLPHLKDFRLRGGNITLTEDLSPYDDSFVSQHPSLEFVELSLNGIKEVPPGSLRRLAGISVLHLWGNNIESLTADSFIGMERLVELDVSRNPLRELAAGGLARARRLRVLRLVATRLRRLRTRALRGLHELEEILFKFCENNITLESRALAALPSLKKLTFDRCTLEDLPADLLQGDVALLQLTMTAAGLRVLPASVFTDLKQLQTLVLNDNDIEVLPPELFWSLKQLQDLNLDDNAIEVLPEQLFSGLTSLRSVSINNNRLTSIAPDAFQGATGLQSLSLSDNMLSLAPVDAGPEPSYFDLENASPFAPLFKLQELNLSGNQLSQIFSDWRMTLIANLKKIDLSRNNYTKLSIADVQFLSHEVTVDLRHNRITTVEVLEAPAGWPDDAPDRNDTHAVILLNDNPFRCDCRLFSFVRRLRGSKSLVAEPSLNPGEAVCSEPDDLRGRRVTDLTQDSLSCDPLAGDCPGGCVCRLWPGTSSMELDCEHAPRNYTPPSLYGLKDTRLTLKNVDSTDLADLPDHVVFLNLSHTKLKTVPSIPATVREIDLSNNELTEPPRRILQSNVTVRLARNLFECDCSHYEDVVLLQRSVDVIADAAEVRCGAGVEAGSPWAVDAARVCAGRRAGAAGGALAALGVLAAALAALAYKYSLEIKVFLHSRGWCSLARDQLDGTAAYDAFVSFSQDDAQWVAEQLAPKLEDGPRKFKLCLHYRDWVFGDLIPTQIARSVERSRRTVVVLSKSYLKSTWAQLEFRTAHVRAQRERKVRVLVIVLDEIPPLSEIDEELRAYLTTNTYLKVGDPWFWKKLEYALRRKRTYVNEALVEGDKLTRGGLDGVRTADGKLINAAASK